MYIDFVNVQVRSIFLLESSSFLSIWCPKWDDFRMACYEYNKVYGQALADFVEKYIQKPSTLS